MLSSSVFFQPWPLLSSHRSIQMSLRFSSPSNSHFHSHANFIPHHFYTPILLYVSPKSKTSSLKVAAAAAASPPQKSQPTTAPSFRSKPPHQVNILVAGSTGYIGKFVVKELCRRGFNVIAIARERSRDEAIRQLTGATICFSDVTDPAALERSLDTLALPIDATYSGGIQDSWKIDYEASHNSLAAARRHGAGHFVLLSAICVQKPLLEFQHAKLKFEAELVDEKAKDPTFSYSIVRPTAFFKSLGGQVETVKDGKPYVMFGDGKMCSCKPISEQDLASFIADCVVDESKAGKVLPVGGPGKALTPMEQGEMLFRLLGRDPKFVKLPISLMDFVITVLEFLAKIFPAMGDAAEFGRIGRYYAAESMLVLDEETGQYSAEQTPSYGTDTLEEFFARVIREGMAGQELREHSFNLQGKKSIDTSLKN
ncbi:divinyl chlorophyllide a 8-vinyl-reductase, chloroplastic [Phalaenopsis equestris]|uniref:divinyl chlorophyllide a 8-vinyl-reductase, chloroplastic n=1 Tax=Phalaenopsis equestris TaxID=78828 RepID=UPI0009E3BD30|nr:divinyl chlorophyllide a 8-vinyl-reductase, chloroplastic [Phalaenopsis equestris]